MIAAFGGLESPAVWLSRAVTGGGPDGSRDNQTCGDPRPAQRAARAKGLRGSPPTTNAHSVSTSKWHPPGSATPAEYDGRDADRARCVSAALRGSRGHRRARGGGRGAARGRCGDRRRRAGRAGLRDSPGAIARGRPRGGGAPGRDADRARRQGPHGRRASALRRRRAAGAPARAVPGRAARRHDELRPGLPRGRVPAHAVARGALADRAAAHAQQGQPRLLAGATRALPGRARRGARRDGAARDRCAAAARDGRLGARHPHRRQGPRSPGRAAADVRARRRS